MAQQQNPQSREDWPKFVPLQIPGRDMQAAAAAMRAEVEDGRERPAPWNMLRLETPAERRPQEGES